MSRLTGTDAYGLMEAYQAVYAPQELTEEQVWEEVENWVNSLLEEGYDLSDYTWEEMYEEYLEEIYGTNLGGNTKTKPNKLDTAVGNAIKSITSSGADATPRTTGIYGQPTRKPASPTFQNTGGFGRYAPPSTQVKTPAPAAPANRTPGLTPVPITRTPAPATKPAAPAPAAARPSGGAPRPSAGAPAKVSPTPTKPAGPAMGKLGGTTFERRTPTSAELKAAQSARASGASPEKALQAAKSAGGALQQTAAKVMEKPPAFSPTPAAAKTTPTPSTPKAPTLGSKKPGSMVSHFDPFDVIKGHLLDEGYADTEESALAIMANMSEEWRESILNEGDNYDKNRQRAAKRAAERNAARDRGQTGNVPGVGYVTPRRERETYRDAAGTERHTSGAKMPKKEG
jgi:hypothetical protein